MFCQWRWIWQKLPSNGDVNLRKFPTSLMKEQNVPNIGNEFLDNSLTQQLTISEKIYVATKQRIFPLWVQLMGRIFPSQEQNIIGKSLSDRHPRRKNTLRQQKNNSTPEQFNMRHPIMVSNFSVNFFYSVYEL